MKKKIRTFRWLLALFAPVAVFATAIVACGGDDDDDDGDSGDDDGEQCPISGSGMTEIPFSSDEGGDCASIGLTLIVDKVLASSDLTRFEIRGQYTISNDNMYYLRATGIDEDQSCFDKITNSGSFAVRTEFLECRMGVDIDVVTTMDPEAQPFCSFGIYSGIECQQDDDWDDDAWDDDAWDDDAWDDDAWDDDAWDDDAWDDDVDDDDDEGSISGIATDFKEGIPILGATVEAVSDLDGSSFDPPVIETAGTDGFVNLTGIPEGVDKVGIKVSANGYKDTYQYHFDVGATDETFLGISNTVVNIFAGLLGIQLDPEKGFTSGGVYYVNEAGEEESVGCAEVSFDPGVAEVHYFTEGFLGVMPTVDRDTDGNGIGDENGKGTNPLPDADGDPMSFFVAINAEPGAYTVSADADGNGASSTIPMLFPGSVAITTVLYSFDVFPTNPTGDWCTE